MIDIPKTATVELSDVDRFLIGFKQLCEETNMYQVEYEGKYPVMIYFKDGSAIGLTRLFKEIGFNVKI